MVLKPDCPSKIYRRHSSSKISQMYCLDSVNIDVLKAEGLWSSLVLPENKLGVKCTLVQAAIHLALSSTIALSFTKTTATVQRPPFRITVPSDLFLFDNMPLKHVHFTPTNHIYQVFQSSSCWQWCDFWLWFLREFREGKKTVYFSQRVSPGQCFHGVSCKAIPSALETWTYWIQRQKS